MGLFDIIKQLAPDLSSDNNERSHGNSRYNKSIDEWDNEWRCIGKLVSADLSSLNHSVGLYRHTIGGETMYVGRALELHNGGLRKRLSDYRRQSNSARTHTSGRTVNEHLNDIVTYVLVVGDDEEAVEVTRKLEMRFIARYNPPWNKIR